MKKNRVFDWLYRHFYEIELWFSGWYFCMALNMLERGHYWHALLDFGLGFLFIDYYRKEKEGHNGGNKN